MYKSTQAFIKKMDEEKVRYTDKGSAGNGNVVTVLWDLKKSGFSVTATFIFDNDSNHAALRCIDFIKVPKDKTAAILAVVNQQNAKFRYGKFVLNAEDNTVRVEADAIFRDHDAGEICFELMIRIVNICTYAYPEFMKALRN